MNETTNTVSTTASTTEATNVTTTGSLVTAVITPEQPAPVTESEILGITVVVGPESISVTNTESIEAPPAETEKETTDNVIDDVVYKESEASSFPETGETYCKNLLYAVKEACRFKAVRVQRIAQGDYNEMVMLGLINGPTGKLISDENLAVIGDETIEPGANHISD